MVAPHTSRRRSGWCTRVALCSSLQWQCAVLSFFLYSLRLSFSLSVPCPIPIPFLSYSAAQSSLLDPWLRCNRHTSSICISQPDSEGEGVARTRGIGERGGGGRERENESGREELTHHGNGKWDAAEYRWTLTGMRVRITECHPYSAGLAAVSGQCYRYISIITFSLAAQRSAAFRYTHPATPRCIARPSGVSRSHHAGRFASRRIVCKRAARPRLSHLQFDPRFHGYARFNVESVAELPGLTVLMASPARKFWWMRKVLPLSSAFGAKRRLTKK